MSEANETGDKDCGSCHCSSVDDYWRRLAELRLDFSKNGISHQLIQDAAGLMFDSFDLATLKDTEVSESASEFVFELACSKKGWEVEFVKDIENYLIGMKNGRMQLVSIQRPLTSSSPFHRLIWAPV